MVAKLAPWVLILALALAAAWLWRDRSNAKAEAMRAIEASDLIRNGQIVSKPVEKAALDRLATENETLKAQLEQARKVIPGAKVIQVITARTSPEAVTAIPDVTTHCVVGPGDKLQLRVDQVEFGTKAGNTVLVGSASAWRVDPPPETQLVTGKFEQSMTTVSGLAAPSKSPSWGVGVIGFAGSSGFAPGLALAAPPLTVFGHEIDVGISAGMGTLGVIGSASLVVRP
jgi:hypothetical protein